MSRALKLLDELRRLYPAEPYRVLWQTVYREVIEGWDSMNTAEQRGAAQELRIRVRWRRRAGRLAAKNKAALHKTVLHKTVLHKTGIAEGHHDAEGGRWHKKNLYPNSDEGFAKRDTDN